MTVRILSRDNGFGLSRDIALVTGALREKGFDVETLGMGGDRVINGLRQSWLRLESHWRRAPEVQVFLERLFPACLPLCRNNLLIPNPEWTDAASRPLLARFARVLCKTRHAMDIFAALDCPTSYIGFTSVDRMDANVARERRFFHLAGRSRAKGTEPLLTAWRQHPEWPPLTVVQNAKTASAMPGATNIEHIVDHLDDQSLRRMQNRHLFHICPSEAEGFGHYIMEALSVGAIVLTTDGAPMNELVTRERGMLIPVSRVGALNLSPQYFVGAAGIESAVATALALDAARCQALSDAARRHFLDNDSAFRRRLADCVGESGARITP